MARGSPGPYSGRTMTPLDRHPTAIVPPGPVPEPHLAFVRNALPHLVADGRVVGVAASGSWADGSMDEFSDLDLLVAIEPAEFDAVMAERQALAASLGTLLGAFTGEHVGEPRLLVCLYGAPLLHVDLKFVAVDAIGPRVDDPVVLWEREGRLTQALASGSARYPEPDAQWLEDRFWIWIHYGAGKVARGELFEALDCLAFLRGRVLGPLGLARAGHKPAGVRRVEQRAPELVPALAATAAVHDERSCLAALAASVALYQQLRSPQVLHRSEAEAAALSYLDTLIQRGR